MAKIIIESNSNASSVRALTGDTGPAKVEKAISVPPALEGPHGKAWLVDLSAMRKQANVAEEEDGTIAGWLIEAPWAHPIWHSYALILVHLRPLTDFAKEPKWYLEGASHEMWLYALDPALDRERALSDIKVFAKGWMTPKNFAAQLKLESDHAAIETIKVRGIQPILHGALSPDSDYMRVWASIFGDNMLLDRESGMRGGHPVN
jgi:hypothetical protein